MSLPDRATFAHQLDQAYDEVTGMGVTDEQYLPMADRLLAELQPAAAEATLEAAAAVVFGIGFDRSSRDYALFVAGWDARAGEDAALGAQLDQLSRLADRLADRVDEDGLLDQHIVLIPMWRILGRSAAHGLEAQTSTATSCERRERIGSGGVEHDEKRGHRP